MLSVVAAVTLPLTQYCLCVVSFSRNFILPIVSITLVSHPSSSVDEDKYMYCYLLEAKNQGRDRVNHVPKLTTSMWV